MKPLFRKIITSLVVQKEKEVFKSVRQACKGMGMGPLPKGSLWERVSVNEPQQMVGFCSVGRILPLRWADKGMREVIKSQLAKSNFSNHNSSNE